MVRDIGGGEGGGWREWEEKEEGWEEEGGLGGRGVGEKRNRAVGWWRGWGGGGGARAEGFVLEWGRHTPRIGSGGPVTCRTMRVLTV